MGDSRSSTEEWENFLQSLCFSVSGNKSGADDQCLHKTIKLYYNFAYNIKLLKSSSQLQTVKHPSSSSQYHLNIRHRLLCYKLTMFVCFVFLYPRHQNNNKRRILWFCLKYFCFNNNNPDWPTDILALTGQRKDAPGDDEECCEKHAVDADVKTIDIHDSLQATSK